MKKLLLCAACALFLQNVVGMKKNVTINSYNSKERLASILKTNLSSAEKFTYNIALIGNLRANGRYLVTLIRSLPEMKLESKESEGWLSELRKLRDTLRIKIACIKGILPEKLEEFSENEAFMLYRSFKEATRSSRGNKDENNYDFAFLISQFEYAIAYGLIPESEINKLEALREYESSTLRQGLREIAKKILASQEVRRKLFSPLKASKNPDALKVVKHLKSKGIEIKRVLSSNNIHCDTAHYKDQENKLIPKILSCIDFSNQLPTAFIVATEHEGGSVYCPLINILWLSSADFKTEFAYNSAESESPGRIQSQTQLLSYIGNHEFSHAIKIITNTLLDLVESDIDKTNTLTYAKSVYSGSEIVTIFGNLATGLASVPDRFFFIYDTLVLREDVPQFLLDNAWQWKMGAGAEKYQILGGRICEDVWYFNDHSDVKWFVNNKLPIRTDHTLWKPEEEYCPTGDDFKEALRGDPLVFVKFENIEPNSEYINNLKGALTN